nr:hypothetical protein Itr_chr08CG11450 [Ipomoea trifida]
MGNRARARSPTNRTGAALNSNSMVSVAQFALTSPSISSQAMPRIKSTPPRGKTKQSNFILTGPKSTGKFENLPSDFVRRLSPKRTSNFVVCSNGCGMRSIKWWEIKLWLAPLSTIITTSMSTILARNFIVLGSSIPPMAANGSSSKENCEASTGNSPSAV